MEQNVSGRRGCGRYCVETIVIVMVGNFDIKKFEFGLPGRPKMLPRKPPV